MALVLWPGCARAQGGAPRNAFGSRPRTPALGAHPSGQTALAKNRPPGRFSLSAPPARAPAWGAVGCARCARRGPELPAPVGGGCSGLLKVFPESFVPRRWTPLDKMRALMLRLVILERCFQCPLGMSKPFPSPSRHAVLSQGSLLGFGAGGAGFGSSQWVSIPAGITAVLPVRGGESILPASKSGKEKSPLLELEGACL